MITRWDLNELNHSEDELYHHGVMGMRWGHRKQEPSSGVRSSSDKAARRKKIARNVAIGVGAAAAVGAGLYVAKKKGLIGGKTEAQAMSSGSGQVKRLLQQNGNVKVSKIKMLPSPAEPQMQGPVWKPNRLKTLKATKVGENSGITWARSRMPDGNGGRTRIRFRGTRYTERTPIL
jgi:hypothetical protein